MRRLRLAYRLCLLGIVLVLVIGFSLGWPETLIWKTVGVLAIFALPLMAWVTFGEARAEHRALDKKARLWRAFRRGRR